MYWLYQQPSNKSERLRSSGQRQFLSTSNATASWSQTWTQTHHTNKSLKLLVSDRLRIFSCIFGETNPYFQAASLILRSPVQERSELATHWNLNDVSTLCLPESVEHVVKLRLSQKALCFHSNVIKDDILLPYWKFQALVILIRQ